MSEYFDRFSRKILLYVGFGICTVTITCPYINIVIGSDQLTFEWFRMCTGSWPEVDRKLGHQIAELIHFLTHSFSRHW